MRFRKYRRCMKFDKNNLTNATQIDRIYEQPKKRRANKYSERYRSGHNGPDSKSGSPQGLVGSNPTRSATEKGIIRKILSFFLAISTHFSRFFGTFALFHNICPQFAPKTYPFIPYRLSYSLRSLKQLVDLEV